MSKQNNILFLIYFLLLIFSVNTIAEKKINIPFDKLFLEGDNVEYDKLTQKLSATGNVIIHFQDYTIKADSFYYNSLNKNLYFNSNFQLSKKKFSIDANAVTYNIKTGEGNAENIKSHIEKFYIQGRNVSILPKQISIQKASFTTCSLKKPHYQIKADKLEIYPQLGLFVAYNNFLYLYDVPVFYFPTYIYTSKIYNLSNSNSPIPEIGYSNLEGWYIKEKWEYFFNNFSTGSIDFGYTSNLFLFMGISHRLNLNDFNHFKFQAYFIQKFGLTGNLQYILDFSKKRKLSNKSSFIENIIMNFIPDKNISLNQLSILFAWKKLINDYWIDYQPLIQLKIKNYNFPYNIKLSSNLNLGQIAELQQDNFSYIKSSRINFNSKLDSNFYFQPFFKLQPSFEYFGNWYDNSQSWNRVLGKLKYAIDTDMINLGIVYTKILKNIGNSPFGFDSKDVENIDELGYFLTSKIPGKEFSLESNYPLNSLYPRNFDLSIKFAFHCYKLEIKIKFIQKDILLGLELL